MHLLRHSGGANLSEDDWIKKWSNSFYDQPNIGECIERVHWKRLGFSGEQMRSQGIKEQTGLSLNEFRLLLFIAIIYNFTNLLLYFLITLSPLKFYLHDYVLLLKYV